MGLTKAQITRDSRLVAGPLVAALLSFGPEPEGAAELVRQRISQKWLDCTTYQVAVDTPKFVDQGMAAYDSLTGELVIVDAQTDQTIFCRDIGGGWRLVGFRTVATHPGAGQQTSVFEISGEGVSRYFDVRNGGNEVYIRTDSQGQAFLSESPEPEPGTVIEVAKSWSGADSRFEEAAYYRLLAQQAWQDLWALHANDNSPAPTVDFDVQMVIAIFAGRTANASGVRTHEIRALGDTIRVRFDLDTYQTVGRIDEATPFGMFVVSRALDALVLEENVQRYIGGPPRWRTVKTFEAVR